MYKISLKEYKENMQYFYYFDILIKDLDVNKEFFLKDNGISPSTYRKCRTIYQNIGDKIIESLCNVFKVKYVSKEFIEIFEDRINKIYNNLYYKIYDTYEDDLNYLDNLLKEDYIIKPIILLMKLEMLANYPIDISKYIKANVDEYFEVRKYINFFNEDLLELFDIISFAFEKNIPEKSLMKNYNNSLAYFTLASKLCDNRRYAESIFMAKKAEELLIKEHNYKRLVNLNIKVMHCLNLLENYKECFELASNQLYNLKSFINVDFELKYTIQNLVISALALGKYKYVEEILINKESLSINECFYLLIAEYKLDKNKYNEIYSFYLSNSNDNSELFVLLNNYLITNNKKVLLKFENTKIIEKTINILKIA